LRDYLATPSSKRIRSKEHVAEYFDEQSIGKLTIIKNQHSSNMHVTSLIGEREEGKEVITTLKKCLTDEKPLEVARKAQNNAA